MSYITQFARFLSPSEYVIFFHFVSCQVGSSAATTSACHNSNSDFDFLKLSSVPKRQFSSHITLHYVIPTRYPLIVQLADCT